ncbi:MAG: GntR family transcriptional regulator [Parvularculaceae bacterium]
MQNNTLENTLIEMILREELPPGMRLTEAAIAERLGVSRTPVRNILPRLAAEGFLKPKGKRGYVVADFSEDDIFDALEMRAVLEGWAARRVVEKGVKPETLAELESCLAAGDELFEKRHLDLEDERRYGVMNARFHRLIVEACQSPLLTMFIDRLNNVPFVTPSVIVFDQIGLRQAFDMLHRAHGTHHAIVDALKNRDGARAEILFREHANHQRISMFERRRSAQYHSETTTKKPISAKKSRRKKISADDPV